MMEAAAVPCNSPSKVVSRRSTNSSFAFIEDFPYRRGNQKGFFFRHDDKGTPVVTGVPFAIHYGAWTNVGFCNELLFYRSPAKFDEGYAYLSTCTCYVANGALLQRMAIPLHPDVIDNDDNDDYSIVGLGLNWFHHSDLWKLVAVLKSNLDTTSGTVDPGTGQVARRSTTFGDDGFAKIGTFDPETEAWTTVPALFSEEFKNFELDSDLFYLTSSPVYHGEALYWVHGWNAKGPHEYPDVACYPYNVNVCGGPGREGKQPPPLSLLKLCLKTNYFRVIPMPLNDKRNIGLLGKSEEAGGRLIYCHLCPTEGLRVWVLLNDDHDHPTSTTSVWHQTYYIPAQAIDFCHDDDNRKRLIESYEERKRECQDLGIPYEDLEGNNEDMNCRVCNKDFVSVHAFNEELHTILFKLNGFGCSNDVVCFDFEEKKVLFRYHIWEYWNTDSCMSSSSLKPDPATPLGEVARLWIHNKKAPYKDSTDINSRIFGRGIDLDPSSRDRGAVPNFLKSCGILFLKS